jgi:SAM pointed domain-containing ETS transcription factor
LLKLILFIADPMLWSTGDVKAWVMFTLQHFNLPMIPAEYFAMDGVALMTLTEEDFNQRAPQVVMILL